MSTSELRQIFPLKFDHYFKFAFVRNPWDRLVSTFFYLENDGACGDDPLKKASWIDPAGGDFTRFVKDVLSSDFDSLYKPNHLLPQHVWFVEDGELMVDFVGRYESLQADWAQLAPKLNAKAELPVFNRSQHKHYTEYYDDEMVEIVANIYQQDIELFDYQYGD
jgi:hypothetical protein